MKNWQLWRKNEEGFWGVWDSIGTTDLENGPYWVIPSGEKTVVPIGAIDGYRVASGNALACQKRLNAEGYEEIVFWYLALDGEAFPIGRWALDPVFLDECPPPTEPLNNESDEPFFEMFV